MPRSLYLTFLIMLLGMGCSSSSSIGPDLEAADPNDRARSIVTLVGSSGEDHNDIVAALVDRLEDQDGAVRMFAIAGLFRLTGERLGYRPSGAIEDRDRSVERWRSRLRQNAEGLEAAP